MKAVFQRLLRATKGQDVAEYGVALAVVGVIAASAASAISAEVRMLWTRALQVVIVTLLGN